jgi:hypothetical protein
MDGHDVQDDLNSLMASSAQPMIFSAISTLLADHHHQVLPKVWNDCIIVLVLSLCGTRTPTRTRTQPLRYSYSYSTPFGLPSTSTILLLAVVVIGEKCRDFSML